MLLSVVLKCCCHGSSTERENRLFLPLCVLRPACGSKPSIREGCWEGLPPRPRPGVGWTKGLTARLASGTPLICDFEICSHSHWVVSVARELMRWRCGRWVDFVSFCGWQALQSVGNLGLQLGHGKEQWMAPLHPIILRSVASVKDFLDKLIDIDHDIGKADSSEHTRELVIKRNVQRSSCLTNQLQASCLASSWYQDRTNNTVAPGEIFISRLKFQKEMTWLMSWRGAGASSYTPHWLPNLSWLPSCASAALVVKHLPPLTYHVSASFCTSHPPFFSLKASLTFDLLDRSGCLLFLFEAVLYLLMEGGGGGWAEVPSIKSAEKKGVYCSSTTQCTLLTVTAPPCVYMMNMPLHVHHKPISLPVPGLCAVSEVPQRAVFMPSVTVKEGYLHKHKAEGPQLLSRFAFKKRYFWLTSETLSYAKTPDWQVGTTAVDTTMMSYFSIYLTFWICLLVFLLHVWHILSYFLFFS